MCFSSVSLIALAIAGGTAAQDPPRFHDYVIEVRRPGEAPVATLDSTRARLGARRVTVTAGATLERLLQAQRVYPDGEAYAAVYYLNPGLRSPALTPGSTVFVPAVSLPDSASLPAGYVTALVLDVRLKQRVLSRVRQLSALEARLADVPDARLGGAQAKSDVRGAVATTREFAIAVGLALQERTRPVDAAVLTQIDRELQTLQEALAGVLGPSTGGLDAGARAAIVAVADQASARAPYWTETHGPEQLMEGYPEALVEVRIVAARNPAPVLRVYYIDELSYTKGQPDVFSALSAPMRQRLGVANYRIWAGLPGDTTARTDVVPVRVRERSDTTPLVVELKVRVP